MKKRYDFKNCSSLKNLLSKYPKFYTFYQGLVNLLRKHTAQAFVPSVFPTYGQALLVGPARCAEFCLGFSGLAGLHGFGGLARI